MCIKRFFKMKKGTNINCNMVVEYWHRIIASNMETYVTCQMWTWKGHGSTRLKYKGDEIVTCSGIENTLLNPKRLQLPWLDLELLDVKMREI